MRPCTAPVKLPFFVAEQLGFDQLVGNRTAVDGDKRRVLTRAVIVNRAGNQFLARAGFADDEGGRIGRRNPFDLFV